MSGKERLQHKSTRWRCEILGKWTTIARSKTWAGSATHMWTRCPRKTLSHGSLTTKHYRVQVGNHQRGYQNPCIRYTLKKELLLLEQINQWLGVLGTHIEWRLQVSRPQNTTHVCMTNLEWFQKNKTIFLKFMAATCIICTWIRESHYFHPNICFMNETRRNAYTSFQH